VKKPSKTLVLVISCILPLAALGLWVLRAGGVFRGVDSRFSGTCREIALAGSSEDIQVDRQRGIAYLALLDRDDVARGGAGNGTVMLLDLNLADPAPRAAMSHDPANFRPHGLSLWRQPGQPDRLFAISHPADGSHAVEIAEQGSSGFVPVTTVRDALFDHPNAIAAVGPREFYLVNDRPEHSHWRDNLGVLTRSGRGSLVYYDGASARVLVDDLAFPAGLALSPDGTRLYVGEALGQAVRVYRRAADGALALERRVDLDAAPDNLNVDADGVVWIAAHPRLFSFLAHARDASRRAPSMVLKFDPRDPEAGVVTLYSDDGARISAGTVAARWRDEFLMGALFDKKVLICKPNP
jgi:arylesterase/paraoxonase